MGGVVADRSDHESEDVLRPEDLGRSPLEPVLPAPRLGEPAPFVAEEERRQGRHEAEGEEE